MNPGNEIQETTLNFIAEGTRIEGRLAFQHFSRVHGILIGEVRAAEGSTLILSETSVVEGSIEADTLVVDGYVRGDIVARKKVVISATGRVVGNIQTPSLALEFGSYFEGKCAMANENSPQRGHAPVTVG